VAFQYWLYRSWFGETNLRTKGAKHEWCGRLRPRPGAEVASQSPRRERVRQQLPDAVSVERSDEKEIDFTHQVVDRADGGNDYARSIAVGHFPRVHPFHHPLGARER
jgi:hypothetical protein